MRAAKFWPAFVVCLIALQTAIVLILVGAAAGDPSFAVEQDYYRRALDWEHVQEQMRANERLGWSVEFDVGGPQGVPPTRPITARITDAAGTAINGADVRLRAFYNARAQRVQESRLSESSQQPGVYLGSIRDTEGGMWVFEFTVVAEGDRFTFDESRYLPRGKR